MGPDATDRSALESMLIEYSTKQLVDEVLIAWEELTKKNNDFSDLKQKIRILELDLAEREDGIAPEIARLKIIENELTQKEQENITLNSLLLDANERISAQESVLSLEERNRLLDENIELGNTIEEQTEIIEEMEGKIDQMLEALQKAANVGLTSISLEEFQKMRVGLESSELELEGERGAIIALEGERSRLRDIIEKLRGMLDLRDKRLLEVEEQVENLMRGPKSVSAEHDYLVEQIEELKRRLVERNREFEVLRRRERGLHNDVFERDERIQQMQLTMVDLEGGLQDRTAELRALEGVQEQTSVELEAAKRSERTRGLVGKMFSDSLTLTKDHEKRIEEQNQPKKERKISTPTMEDIERLVDGEEINLIIEEKDLETSNLDLENNPSGPGGSAVPLSDED
jgi:chromosome segregation ATPase